MFFHVNAHHDPEDHHDHNHLEDDFDVPMASGELSGFSAALWSTIKTYHLLTVAFVVTVLVAYARLLRRRRRMQTPGTDYAAETSMNMAIRRARALESMQQEYDRKAQEFKEIQAKRQRTEAEERAGRVAGSRDEHDGGGGGGHAGGTGHSTGATAWSGTGGGGGGGNSGGRGNPDWTPLLGSGTVGGFRSQRCVRRGG